MWGVIDYDSLDDDNHLEEEDDLPGFFSNVFCCGGRDKPADKVAGATKLKVGNHVDSMDKLGHEQEDIITDAGEFKVRDDDDVGYGSDYDKNEVYKQNHKKVRDVSDSLGAISVIEDKKGEKGGCYII